MAMIVAGMDVSGDQRSGNHKFMSLVFGTQESLDAITRRLGSDQIHMNMIKNRKVRDDIIRQVRFDGIECIGFCMRLEKAQTIARAKKLVGRKHRPSAGKVHKAYHFLVWRCIRDRIEEFLRHHGCEVRSIRFQCDADCRDFAKDLGWKYADVGPAHSLEGSHKPPSGVTGPRAGQQYWAVCVTKLTTGVVYSGGDRRRWEPSRN